MNKLKQTLHHKQTQSLLLKPKMLQSLEMLAMPLLELDTHLKQELESNPMLELAETREDEQEESEKGENDNNDEADDEQSEEIQETLKEVEELSEILDSWNDQYEDKSYSKNQAEAPEYDQFMKAIVDLKRGYVDQLDKLHLTDNEYDFAFDLIDSANAHGFLPENFDLHEFALEYEISMERADQIHDQILHFSPKGITARNVQECLIAQLDEKKHSPQLKEMINYHFDNLIHKRYKRISSHFGVSNETVLKWRSQISKLDPKPGLRILNNKDNYIVPDVIVKKIGDDYEVFSNDFSIPRIRLSRRYKKVLKQVKDDKQGIDYVRNKINSAKFLIKSIFLRGRTLEKVMKSIIRNQMEFFYEESGVLRPLTYSVIADELHVNESTISRVVRTKYVDSPFGIMCLKDFFSSKAGKDNRYNSVSRQNVEIIVKKMINAEEKSSPLSDQEIVEKLAEMEINVSRRVVAKYRKCLGILNSHQRKKE